MLPFLRRRSANHWHRVMKAINRVHAASHTAACHALGDLIASRLLPDLMITGEPNHQILTWIEQICVTYALLVVRESGRAQHATIEWLREVYDTIFQVLNDTLSSKATHAIQALLYKASATNDANVAEKWLQLLRHSLFSNTGEVNQAKIARCVRPCTTHIQQAYRQ